MEKRVICFCKAGQEREERLTRAILSRWDDIRYDGIIFKHDDTELIKTLKDVSKVYFIVTDSSIDPDRVVTLIVSRLGEDHTVKGIIDLYDLERLVGKMFKTRF